MIYNIDLKKVLLWDLYIEKIPENKIEAEKMMNEAKEFLEFYDWVEEITEIYVGLLYLEIVGVFLFHIKPSKKNIDSWIWVIVGDIPPAYITTEECSNPATALDGYIGAMLEWIKAAKENKSVKNLIPVNIPATEENANLLQTRLNFLDKNILINYINDLKE